MAAYIRTHGATSLSELRQVPLSLFGLPLIQQEARDIVESARRHGIIQSLGHEVDVDGHKPSETEWVATSRGHKLAAPRGITFHDFASDVPDLLPGGQAALKFGVVVAAVGVAALRLLGSDPVKASDAADAATGAATKPDPRTYLIAAGIVLAVGLLAMLRRGLQGDAELRHAAKSWERLRETCPNSYAWQARAIWRWCGVAGVALYVAGFALAPVLPLVADLPLFLASGVLWSLVAEMKERSDRDMQLLKAGGT